MTGRKISQSGKLLVIVNFLFLYLPIVILIIFSFNSTKSRSVWSGFTLEWYGKLFSNELVINSLYVTLAVSALAAAVAAGAGTFAAVGFFNMKRKLRTPLLSVNNIPVINADIITGVSLSLLFVFAGAVFKFNLGFGTLLIAHISFNIPYVILSVMPKLYQLDKNLFEAARDLGCTWLKGFFKVIIPEIMPGVINGFIIAFTMSIDDFVISYFTAGSRVQTLSMTIYSMTRKRVSPEINAVSTLLFLAVIILLSVINILEIRRENREKQHAAYKGGQK